MFSNSRRFKPLHINFLLLSLCRYVMSNHLVASYLAMVSEDRNMNQIYGQLLSCRGSEIQVMTNDHDIFCRDAIDIVRKIHVCMFLCIF